MCLRHILADAPHQLWVSSLFGAHHEFSWAGHNREHTSLSQQYEERKLPFLQSIMWNYHSIHGNLACFSLPWQELCRREGKLPCSPSRGLTHISHLSWCLSFLLDWDNKCSFSKEHQQQNSWTENVKHLWDILFDTFWKYTSIPEEWEHSVWQSMRVYLSSADVASEEREREISLVLIFDV